MRGPYHLCNAEDYCLEAWKHEVFKWLCFWPITQFCTWVVPCVSVRDVVSSLIEKWLWALWLKKGLALSTQPTNFYPPRGIIPNASCLQKPLLALQHVRTSSLPTSQVPCSYLHVRLSTSGPPEKAPEGRAGSMSLNTSTPSRGTEALPSRILARHPLPRAQDWHGASLRLQLGPGEQSSSQADLLGGNLQPENRFCSLSAGKMQNKKGITKMPCMGPWAQQKSVYNPNPR